MLVTCFSLTNSQHMESDPVMEYFLSHNKYFKTDASLQNKSYSKQIENK